MKTTRNLLMAGMVAAFCCSMANAQIVYSNDFSGGSAVNIDQVAPTMANTFAGGSSSALWTVASNLTHVAYMYQDGAIGAANNAVLLPFTVQPGYIYTLSAQLTYSAGAISGNNNIWVGLGFTTGVPAYSTTPRFIDPSFPGGPWGNITLGGNDSFFYHRASTSGSTVQITPNLGTYNLEITLDTSGSSWLGSYFINGTQVGTTYAFASSLALKSVGFTQNNFSGYGLTGAGIQWDNMLLTAVAVPEPSTPALIGLGAAMLLLVTLYRSRRNVAGKTIQQ